MDIVPGADAHGVQAVHFHHLIIICKGIGDVIFCGIFRQPLLIDITGRDNLQIVQAFITLHMAVADSAGANDTDS